MTKISEIVGPTMPGSRDESFPFTVLGYDPETIWRINAEYRSPEDEARGKAEGVFLVGKNEAAAVAIQAVLKQFRAETYTVLGPPWEQNLWDAVEFARGLGLRQIWVADELGNVVKQMSPLCRCRYEATVSVKRGQRKTKEKK